MWVFKRRTESMSVSPCLDIYSVTIAKCYELFSSLTCAGHAFYSSFFIYELHAPSLRLTCLYTRANLIFTIMHYYQIARFTD